MELSVSTRGQVKSSMKRTGRWAASLTRPSRAVCGVRLEGGSAICEAGQEGSPFAVIGDMISCPKTPTALRVGKTGMDGSGADAGRTRRWCACTSQKVTWRTAVENAAPVASPDLPEVEVHYNIYGGIPLFSKWLVVRKPDRQDGAAEPVCG